MTTMLRISGLQCHYGRTHALKDVDLTVEEGELVALIGGNGAGKSTLIRTVSGVHRASGGSIEYRGEDITTARPDRRVRLGIAQVPEGRQLFAPLTVEDNLKLGAFTQQGGIEERLETMYGLWPVLKEKRHLISGTLSGGQQQMVAIGRALMASPKLLLLDEPSMGLAPIITKEIFDMIVRLRTAGTTILLVEQNAHAGLSIADRAYVLETGNIVISDTGRALLRSDHVRRSYLGA